MSGGLDSSTLAAKAVAVAGDASRVIADTCYFEHLIPDEEKHFSSLVASRLGIRLTLRPVDDTCYDRLWETRDIQPRSRRHRLPGRPPSASLAPKWRSRHRSGSMARDRTTRSRSNGEPISAGYGQRDWPRFGGAMVQYLRSKQAREWRTTFKTYAFRRRKEEIDALRRPPMDGRRVRQKGGSRCENARREPYWLSAHPWRPRAIASFTSAIWPSFLDGFDVAVSGVPIEWRHPYLDLRVLTFLLSVPPIPWARRKFLIRKAMKGVLPEEVLSRGKAPLADDPVVKMLQKYPLRVFSCVSGSGICKRSQSAKQTR